MANMSYCQFENTLLDLQSCQAALQEHDKLSERERDAKEQLLNLCREMVEQFGEEDQSLDGMVGYGVRQPEMVG